MASALPIEKLTGQLLVVGFHGTSLPAELEARLAAGERGGTIVFKRNLPDLQTAHALNRQALAATPAELPPFLAVDQRVAASPDCSPFVKLPPMRRLGTHGDADLVRRVGEVLGAELALLGYNLDFAPVFDVDSNPDNPVIGDRAFSADPSEVGRLAGALVDGLQDSGVMACAKHFPGHGDTSLDSHLDLPFVRHPESRLRALEIPPFIQAIRHRVASMMTAHVVYDAFEPERPATLSERIVRRLLRDELGFEGVLFSDDLEMRALADRMPVEESAVGAIRAGCDALLVCSDLGLAARAHAALVSEASLDAAFRARCQEAFERGITARRRFPPNPAASASEVGGPRARELEAELGRILTDS